MPKSIALLAITFLLVPAGFAQEKKESMCRFRFAVAERIGLDRRGVWPEDERKWWDKDGRKKFPELCEAASQDADFVIAWEKRQTTEKYGVLRQEDTPAYGFLRPGYCYAGPNGETNCEPAAPDPAAATFHWDWQERQVERVSVTVCRVRQGQFERVASFSKVGFVPTDRPGRASFKSAMKALKKKAMKPGQLKTRGHCGPEMTRKEKRFQTQRREQRFQNPQTSSIEEALWTC